MNLRISEKYFLINIKNNYYRTKKKDNFRRNINIKITHKIICVMERFRYCYTGTTTVYIIYRYTVSSIDVGNRFCETSVLYYRDVQNRIKKKGFVDT